MRADKVKKHEIIAGPLTEMLFNIIDDFFLYSEASKIATICNIGSLKLHGLLTSMFQYHGVQFFKLILEV